MMRSPCKVKESILKYAKLPENIKNYGLQAKPIKKPHYGEAEYTIFLSGVVIGSIYKLKKESWYYRLGRSRSVVGSYRTLAEAGKDLKAEYMRKTL